jgi:hypothetical protein
MEPIMPRLSRLAIGLLAGVALVLGATLLARALTTPGTVQRAAVAVSASGSGSVTLLAWFDLPRDDPRSVELSGIAWDDATRTLFAISDNMPEIVPLRPTPDYRAWFFGEVIRVDVPAQWDGEGIVLVEEGFAIANEFGPHVFLVDRGGRATAELPLPEHFSRILRNRAFEALTISPDGRSIFVANETALDGDGPQPSETTGTTVRILHIDRNTLRAAEYAYRTDAVFAPGEGGNVGVADMAALSEHELLVLERHFVPNTGNTVRIYRVGLAGAADVIDVENLSTETPTVPKTLLVDLAALPDGGVPPLRQPQPNRLLDNYEGLALGPLLPDGRRVLFVISDDNGNPMQTPRILVLAANV